MGNGAIKLQDKYEEIIDNYSLIEKKLKEGYYLNNYEEYQHEVINSIKNEEIGILELLIKVLDISKLLPIHIAVKYASLDCLELLLSAGISPLLIDKDGSIALHRAVGIQKDKSDLCVYTLILHSPRSINTRDFKGNTPLHIAITVNNISAVEILLLNGASITITNSAGHSPRQLALSMKYQEIVDMIDRKRTGKPIRIIKNEKQKQSAADMERIMKVWERFFENALSGIDFSEINNDYNEDNNDDSNDYSGSYKTNHEKNKKDVSKYKYNYGDDYDYDDNNYDDNNDGDNTYKSSKSLKSSKSSKQKELDEQKEYELSITYNASCWWFAYVLCYDTMKINENEMYYENGSVIAGSIDGYYVASCLNLSEVYIDLDDHLYNQEQYYLWYGYTFAQEQEELSWNQTGSTWPTTIKDLIQRGWINCYLLDTNECVWMNLLNQTIERYLPVGYDEMSGYCGLEWYDEEGYWMKPPQVTARSWMMIRCQINSNINNNNNDNMNNNGDKDENENDSKDNFSESKDSKLDKSYSNVSDEKKGSSKYDDRGSIKNIDSIKISYDNFDTSYDSDEKVSIKNKKQANDEKDVNIVNNNEVWYYYNRVTGHSIWTEPEGWNDIVSLAGGWILCAEENAIDNMYWWNLETGDTIWYSEEYE